MKITMWKCIVSGITAVTLLVSPMSALAEEENMEAVLEEEFLFAGDYAEEDYYEEDCAEESVVEDNDSGEDTDEIAEETIDDFSDDEMDVIADGLFEEETETLEAAEEPGIPIDEEHFPDPLFRWFVSANFDTDSVKGVLSSDEIKQVEEIDIGYDAFDEYYDLHEEEEDQDVRSLEGIEYFTELQTLDVMTFYQEYPIDTVDLSHNLKLRRLCIDKSIRDLNIENNLALEEVALYYMLTPGCEMTSLDLSNYPALRVLECYSNNGLKSINVSGCTALEKLRCHDNDLETLDVSGCVNLKYLQCSYNSLSALDVSDCTQLGILYCYNNQLSQLDVSHNTKLTRFDCNYNQLTALDVKNNTLLEGLWCSGNQISSLEMGSLTQLTELSCSTNNLRNIDVSSYTALQKLWCGANPLQGLNVSNNTNLTFLHCYNSGLTELDISNNTKLMELYCHQNQLNRLDISNCPDLLEVYLNGDHTSEGGVEKHEEYFGLEGGYGDRGLYVDSLVTVITSDEQMYTITWDFNGGTDIHDSYGPRISTGASGWEIHQPIIEKEGFILEGWSTEQGGNIVLEADDSGLSAWTVEGDVTLYAVWSVDEDYEDDPIHIHTYENWITTTNATCTTVGVETGTCECGETTTRSIPALGHSFGAWSVLVPATEDAEGLQTRTCSRCGQTETATIPKIAVNVTILKAPSLSKPKAAKGKATITWKKFKQTKKTKPIWKKIKKVEVQYSTDPIFKTKTTKLVGKTKTKLVVKGLQKNTTYYVRVRYTDSVGGYSAWSSVKKVKTKK